MNTLVHSHTSEINYANLENNRFFIKPLLFKLSWYLVVRLKNGDNTTVLNRFAVFAT